MRNWIGFYREYYGMSQRKLASKAGISHAEMNYIEAGKRIPSVLYAIRIANALNTTVENLFLYDGKEPEI